MIALIVGVAVATIAGFGAGFVCGRRACPHRWTLQISRSRIFLSCPLCGVESPGWDLRLDSLSDRRVH